METKEFNEIKRDLIAAYHALKHERSNRYQGTQVNQITDIMQSIRVCAYYKDVRLRAAAETLLIFADIILCNDSVFFCGKLRGIEYRKDLTDGKRQAAAQAAYFSFAQALGQAEENAVYCLKQLDNNGEGGKA